MKKTKERTIGEAVKAVKIWRELYETVGDNWKRKYTLEEAAREIGMAKKTLDDYNNHIRMAIENKFNFEKYENSKIGVLRKFIKLVKRGDEEIAMEQYVIDNDIDKYWIDFN